MKNPALELVEGTYAEEIHIFLDKNKTDKVDHIVVMSGATGGLVPHFKSGADGLCQSYVEKFKENLKQE